MEIDITHFVKTAEPCEFSASQMELGANVGKITWENAKREAGESPLLYLEAGLGAFRSRMFCRLTARRLMTTESKRL